MPTPTGIAIYEDLTNPVDDIVSKKAITPTLTGVANQVNPHAQRPGTGNAYLQWIQQQYSNAAPATTGGGSGDVMSGLPSISYNPKDPGATLADITKQNQYVYENAYAPVLPEVTGTIGDNSIVNAAKQRAVSGFDNMQGQTQRGLSRYGVELNPLQQQQFNKQSALGRSSTYDNTLNEAEIAQRARDENLRNEIINIGRGVAQEASSSFAGASATETQRRATNKAAEAANNAAGVQTAGQIASGAIMLWAAGIL